MARWLFCLPLCLLLQDQRPLRPDSLPEPEFEIRTAAGTDALETLRQSDPLAFLELCLERYRHEVRGYTCLFLKQERIRGKLQNQDRLDIRFREDPFAVYMKWLTKPRLDGARAVLYVKGENRDKEGKEFLLALPVIGFLGLQEVPIHGPKATSHDRYTIDQFGMGAGMERTLDSMRKARERGALHLRYQGIIQDPRTGDRPCYLFLRKPYQPPEEEGVAELAIYVDQETWLQVGSVLRDVKGETLAEYFFRDIVLNPTFGSEAFHRKSLK